MRKLRLHPEDLAVESFLPVSRGTPALGTVRGQQEAPLPEEVVGAPGHAEPRPYPEPDAGSGPYDTCRASCSCSPSCPVAKCPSRYLTDGVPCC